MSLSANPSVINACLLSHYFILPPVCLVFRLQALAQLRQDMYTYICVCVYECVYVSIFMCVCVCSKPGGGHSNPFQYSCLENPMDRGGAWQAMVHTVAMSWTRLRQLSTHAHILQTHGFLESDLVKILAL